MPDDNNLDEIGEIVQVHPNPQLPPPVHFPGPQNAVAQQMQRTRNGAINSRSHANVARILELDTRWVGKLGYNSLSDTFMQRMTQDEFQPMTNGFICYAMRWIAEVYETSFGKQNVKDALESNCLNNTFHPIQSYLNSCPKPPIDDEGNVLNPQLETFFIDAFDVVDTPLNRAYSKGFFLGAVKRGLEPGSKVDNMLVLVGDQGAGKSSLFEKLCPDPIYFSDTKLKIGTKDAMAQIRGKWIFEMSELASIRKAENDAVKQFLTSRVDSFRPAYAPYVQDFPRTCVFVGTVNEQSYLTDWTGNRRFWSMKVRSRVKCLKEIEKKRDALWGEAFYRYTEKKELYYLNDEMEKERERLSRDFMFDDGWDYQIELFLGQKAIERSNPRIENKGQFTINDVLQHLGFDVWQVKDGHVSRVSTILRNKGCGKKRQRRLSEKVGPSGWVTYWFPPEDYIG